MNMKGKILLITSASVLALSGCSKIKMQQSTSLVPTHNICYEIRQQMSENETAQIPNEVGQSPVERARLIKEYDKYNCAEQEVIRH